MHSMFLWSSYWVSKSPLSVCEQWAAGVDLLSLDGCRAIRCCAEDVEFAQVRRFLRLARWVYKAACQD